MRFLTGCFSFYLLRLSKIKQDDQNIIYFRYTFSLKQELVQAQKISELKEAETINTKDMNIQYQNEIQKLKNELRT